jgi:hypothetical protein
MAPLDKARTRCISGEVQYYHKETSTWNMEEGLRERGGKRVILSRVKWRKKGDGLLNKNGRKCKQSELKTGGEMEVDEGKVSEVVGVEPKACTEGQDNDESVTVGVRFLEKVDPCLLADPFVVSGWVKTELGAVRVIRSGLVIIVCFCWSEGAGAPC